jgi:type VI secretion system protein ImpH
MGQSERDSAAAVRDRLARDPYSWGFFKAVRLLNCLYPDMPKTGDSHHASEDPIRFGQAPSLAFPPSDIAGFTPGEGDRRDKMTVHFLGLLGCSGPMPLEFTEYVHNRLRHHGDGTLAAFLDVFHHRMISLYYRAWTASRQDVSRDRPEDDPFAGYIGSFIGLEGEDARHGDRVPFEAKLHYSGRLLSRTRNAEGLCRSMADLFGVDVAINEFCGHWIDIPPVDQCRVGSDPETGSLGRTLVVGSRFWDCRQKFRLRCGPMGFAEFSRLIPGGAAYGAFVDWIGAYAGTEMLWEAQLVLKAEEVPSTCLGKAGQLGHSTWLKSGPMARDAEDLILQ